MTNAQVFIAKFKEVGLDAALKAIGVDPNGERVKRLYVARPSPIGASIIAAVAQEHGITEAQLLAKCELRFLVDARAVVMQRMASEQGWGASRIGRELGCHHSNVLHALNLTKAAKARKRPIAIQASEPALKAVG